MALFVSIVSTGLQASQQRQQRSQQKKAQRLQQKRLEDVAESERIGKKQAALRVLRQRGTRGATPRRADILTGNQLGGTSGEAKTLLGQ